MAQQETNQCQSPLLCVTGCGFFGSPGTNGMCSLCYKDFLQRQNMNGRVSPPPTIGGIGESLLAESRALPVQVPAAVPPPLKDIKHGQSSVHASASATATGPLFPGGTSAAAAVRRVGGKAEDMRTPSVVPQDAPETDDDDKPKAKKRRCLMCRKKLGLTGFDCRCGGLFCSMHRYSDEHDCTFDYKADAAKRIRRENPVLVGEKVRKI